MAAELLHTEEASWDVVTGHPLQNGETFEQLVARTSNVERSLEPIELVINCIDEGIPGGLHMAGSGILQDEDELIAIWHEHKVRGVTSHDGCGAAVAYATERGMPVAGADIVAARQIKRIAERAGVEYRGHIEASALKRPARQHIAFVAYYDATGQFDASRVPELPLGFTISRFLHHRPDVPVAEMGITTKIATSEHGWGRRFAGTGKQFLLVPIGSPSLPLDQLVAELTPFLRTYGRQVRIDGFDASQYLSRVQT